ncbi:MAG TPA: ATP-binding cassette domain-containing protein [Candidatus Eisenbacteria bacterium]|jgi:ATP-binding cassette subfamily F protein 3|nr:ATP-binding cassette domain-containing protein [Candidatus Eisenbacteria bacterium]
MISLTGVAKHYGERTLFSGVNLTLGVSERVGLVGPNGCGKSTLLQILDGTLEPDEGNVSRNRRVRIGMLRQEVVGERGRKLLDEMLSGDEEMSHLESRIALLEEEMRGTSDPATLEPLVAEHGDLLHRFQRGGGYDRPAEAKQILGGLAFKTSDFDRDTAEFSGGWLMRLALAKLLLTEPDLLLLDEPTNYLDLESVVWLEGYLREYEGSLIIASHDRVLLTRLATRIVEIDERRVTSYVGDYEDYLEAREARAEGLRAAKKAQDREIAHTQRFIERFRAKNTKARQVQSRIKKLEKMEIIEGPAKRRTLRFSFPDPPPCGRIALELRGVVKSYDGGPPVYRGLDLTIEKGDRLALVGPNGAGKSTLLKLLAGAIDPDRGERRLDPRARAAYYSQHQVETLDYGRTIYEEIQDTAPELEPQQIRALAGRFLFSGDDAFKTIGVLSGGEKARVALAKLLVHPPNLLLLDEPTSHLDIPSRELLEDALGEYGGALVMISHDRHFLESLANRVVEVGGGGARHYLGTYTEYLEKKEREAQVSAAPPSEPTAARRSREDKRREAEERNARYRALSPLKREVESLEREIEKLEGEVTGLETDMARPDFYEDGARFSEALRRHHDLKAVAQGKLERWTELSKKLEELNRSD